MFERWCCHWWDWADGIGLSPKNRLRLRLSNQQLSARKHSCQSRRSRARRSGRPPRREARACGGASAIKSASADRPRVIGASSPKQPVSSPKQPVSAACDRHWQRGLARLTKCKSVLCWPSKRGRLAPIWGHRALRWRGASGEWVALFLRCSP